MNPNPSTDVKSILNPPLGKKPNLTERQMKNMRMVLQNYPLPPPEKNIYFYNIVSKQSKMGFSENQRLLILNVQQKSVSYFSKIPQGYLPFTYYEQIAANKIKQKIMIGQTPNFKCYPVKGKISSMTIQWTDQAKDQKKWTLILGSSKLMNDWISLLNSVKDGSFVRQKYQQLNKQNEISPLANNNIHPGRLDNVNTTNQIQKHNPQNNQNIPPSNLKNQPSKQDLLRQSQNPFYVDVRGNQLKKNSASQSNLQYPNKGVGQGNKSLSQSNLQNNPTGNLQNSSTGNLQGSKLQNSQGSNIQNQNGQKLVKSNLINQNTKSPQNNFMGGEPQYSRKPVIPKMGDSTPKKAANQQNQPYGQSNILTKAYDIGYSNASKAQTPANQQNNLGYNDPKQSVNKNAIDPNNNPNNLGYSKKVQNSSTNYKHPNQYDFNQPPKQVGNSRTLGQSQSQSPGDFVEELKRKKQKNPDKFNLTNQLSQKKFPQYDNSRKEDYQNPTYSHNNPQNNSSLNNTSQMQGNFQRKPSQHYLNKQNSGDKRIGLKNQQKDYYPHHQQTKPFTRNNTQNLQNNQSMRNNMKKQFSKAQLSNKNQGGPSSGLQNNYDDYQFVENDYQNDQIYKPSTNFPQSTKNLTKIRSDYLQRKAQNLNNLSMNEEQNSKPYPITSNNQGRMLKNNALEQSRQKSRSFKYNQPSFERLPKFDSSQKRRQDSIQNLNKLNSTYLSQQGAKIYPSYNELWLETSNPNKKIQIHQQFITRSRQVVRKIVEELPLPKAHRQYQPIDSYQKQNLYTFSVQNLIITLHFFNQQESINDSSDNINVDAPVLYDQATFEQIKRQFYNYNLVLAVTNNQGRIKVPLCCYVQYRGVLAVIKADIPSNYKEVQSYPYKQQFQALQNIIKVRFLFNTFNCYESQGYRGGQGKFILLWNLRNLIPGIPNTLKNQSSYFRKQFLLQYDQILEDLQSSSQAHAFTLRHIVIELLSKLESLQLQIIHSKDLTREFHRAGLSLSYLPQLYKQTDSVYLKKIFMSEIVAGIFTAVVRSQLNHAFAILPAQNMQNIGSQQLNMIIVDCAHVLINQFFSYTQRSESIWKLIVNEASKKYHIIVSKQDVIPGYLLSSLVHKINLDSDFKLKSFLKTNKFFVHANVIPRQCFITFTPSVRRYDMQSICPTYSKCKQFLESEEASTQNYEHLSLVLNLKTRTNGFQQYFNPLMEELKTYLANFIPYTEEQQYQNLDIYEYMYEQPVCYNGVKTSFLAIKWLIKANQIQKANQVFQIKFHELSFWLNEYNTAITEFYDFFSMFYASIGDFQQSICLAKSSLINVNKVLGQYSLPVADKHYQLGNIYFKINKKNQALKEYNKTKKILTSHQKTTIPEYGIILLKISLLCLNFGELTECLANAIEAQRIFQNNGGNQNQEIECFQILSRVYEITRKQSDINNLCEACGKTFNSTENPKVLERMLKIILFPKLCNLSSQEQKSLLPILLRLQQHSPSTSPYLQCFNYLHKLSLKQINIKKKLYYWLQNITILSDEVNRRDLIRKHSSLNQKANGDGEQMLVVVEAVGNILGWGFLIGSLKDQWYE